MYRAIFPEGDIECTDYDRQDTGVELYTDADELIAFVPYSNLVAIINEEVDQGEERSIM